MAEQQAFDESRFVQRLQLQALRVPKQLCGQISKLLSGYLLDKPRVKHIVPDPADSESRLVILSDSVKDSGLLDIPEGKLASLKELTSLDVVPHELQLGYEHWPADHVLRQLLPENCEVPTAFETIGHIAHLNLRDEHLPYKNLIGKVLLDKHSPRLRTIVNKVGTIKNEFRVPTFELIAGDDDMITEVKQYGATFKLDYSLVYWNSRLEHEHKRVVSEFEPGQVICDMFAGIGPFAIPAAQRGCIVFANDLNPSSAEYLLLNSSINKVSSRLVAYNMDASEFMRKLVNPSTARAHALSSPVVPVKEPENGAEKRPNRQVKKQKCEGFPVAADAKPWEHFDHVVMNLPASALSFLDCFRGLLSRELWRGSMPRVHCYCFLKGQQTFDQITKMAETTIGGSLPDASFWTVRLVAPKKPMLCLSFTLPESIAFGESEDLAKQ